MKVTAVAPDRIDLDDPEAPPSLNLFLYRTSRNQGWAEMGLPSFDGNGTALAHPPLALNLHYLLTAYGIADFQAEILLGYAMHLLHERPVLDRAAIRRALDPSPLGPSILPPAFQALTASDLADQLEAVTITREPMDTEEMSRLWSAIQSHYRPTAAYVVSVVLIEARKPSRTAAVCRGRSTPRGSSSSRACCRRTRRSCASSPTHSQPAARLGEDVRLAGHHLSGSSVVARFAHRLLDDAERDHGRRERRHHRDRPHAPHRRHRAGGLARGHLPRERLARPPRRDGPAHDRTSRRCCSRPSRSSAAPCSRGTRPRGT